LMVRAASKLPGAALEYSETGVMRQSRMSFQNRRLGRAAGLGGLVRASHEDNEAVAPPFFGGAAGLGGLVRASHEGNEAVAPLFFGGPPASAALYARRTRATRPLPLHFFWRAAVLGGLVRASHEGNEAVAPPFFGGPPSSAALYARRTRATRPLPLYFLDGRRPRRPCTRVARGQRCRVSAPLG